MRCLLSVVAAVFACISSFATTTVTGTIKTPDGTAVSSGVKVRLWYRGCSANQPTVNGVALFPPNGSGSTFYVDFPPNASGVIAGTVYSTRASDGVGNGEVSCAGSLTAMWVGVQVFYNGTPGVEVPVHAKNTATLDITQLSPITTTPTIVAPSGDSTYARLDAGNMPFTGNISFAATPATAGTIRFPSTASLQWRNNANGANLSLSKDTADVLHWPGMQEWDCGGSGEPTCSGGLEQIILSDNNNPGVAGNGYFIRWGQRNSAGTAFNPVQLQGGFATVTAGAEQATLDIAMYVNSVVRGIGIGGVVGGGSVPAITPSQNGVWQLGRSGLGFIKARMEGSNPSTEYRNTTATLPNGLHRILETGNDFIINRNTAAGGDFSTNTNDLILRGVDGKAQIGTGVYTDGGGFKHATASTGSIGATTRAEIQITWGTAWADTSYTAVCSVEESSATLQTLLLERIRQKTTTIVTAIIFNPTAGGLTGTLDCIGIHQ
jgi:hypothetical protein